MEVQLKSVSKLQDPETPDDSNKQTSSETRIQLNNQQKYRIVLVATFTACLGAASIGSLLGYASPAISDMNTQQSQFRLPSLDEQSWIVSMVALGELFGALVSGVLVDRYGRKIVIIISCVPFVFGWLLIAAYPNFAWLCVGRFVTGVCDIILDVALPIYLAEIAPPHIRGFIGSCYELFINVGILFVYGLGVTLHFNWLAIACAIIPTVLMIFMCFVPESPRWLLYKGYREAAVEVLKKLRGTNTDIKEELEEITDNINATEDKLTWKNFLQPTLYKPLVIIFALMAFQQLSGFSYITQYLNNILVSANTNQSTSFQVIVYGISGVVSVVISAAVVDRAGRRPMLVISAIIMIIGMTTLGAYFLIRENDARFSLDYLSWVPIVSLVVYNFGYSIGFGSIPFYMACELFPLKSRGIAFGIVLVFCAVVFFLSSKYSVFLENVLHTYAFCWLQAGVSLFAIVFVLTKVPETKGKTLEEIENEFRK